MSLLTIFSAPKPFRDPKIAMIQRNAIGSWRRLPNVEVLLMGNGEGVEKVAREAGAIHVRDVATNAQGTPLISSMLHEARERGSGELLCIINSDMILFNMRSSSILKTNSRFNRSRRFLLSTSLCSNILLIKSSLSLNIR